MILDLTIMSTKSIEAWLDRQPAPTAITPILRTELRMRARKGRL